MLKIEGANALFKKFGSKCSEGIYGRMLRIENIGWHVDCAVV